MSILMRDYDKIVFASDFHYNHQRDFLWKPRGFKSFEEHDKFIEDQIDTLGVDDLLIYLGDYSLNTTDEQTAALLRRTKAQMFYIFGNHEGYHSRFYRNGLNQFLGKWFDIERLKDGESRDHASLMAANRRSVTPFQIFPFSVNKYNGNESFAGIGKKFAGGAVDDITYFGEEGYFKIGRLNYFCRHMAPLIWDKMKYDNFVSICGHSHGNLEKARHDVYDQGKILDVGVDNAIKYNGTAFFSVQDIEKIMDKKKIQIYDHHGDDNV